MLGVHTTVRRHPERGGWAVFAVAAGPLGNTLYVSSDCWVLYESAEHWMRDILDREIDAALHQADSLDDPGSVLAQVEGLVRVPTRWNPKQFEAL